MAALVLGLAVILFRHSGTFLVVDHPEKSDVLVITQGDSLDAQYWVGLRLLKEGYGRELLLDAHTDTMWFGRSQADLAGEFIRKTAGDAGNVKVCPIEVATTAQEAYAVGKCLKGQPVRAVLLVVSDYHSRRSLTMFSHLLPQYRWSITAVHDPKNFEPQWWRRREWVRTTVVEWEHLLWWEILDRWRLAPLRESGPETNAAE